MQRTNTQREIELVQYILHRINKHSSVRNPYQLEQINHDTFALLAVFPNTHVRVIETQDLSKIYAYLYAIKEHMNFQED